MNARVMAVAVVAAFATEIAGCSEREQTALYENDKYRGKRDTRPWDNAPPLASTAQWKEGDHATWENTLRARSARQNEHRRIGH